MRSRAKKLFAVLLAISMTAGAFPEAATAQERENRGETDIWDVMEQDGTKYYAETWTDLGGRGWTDGMISGNGENGVITTGSPYEDRMIFQYMYFNFPSSEPRYSPDETAYLDEARQAVFNLDDSWNVHGRSRTFDYTFHPGHQLALEMEEEPELLDYLRWTDYETAEVGVAYFNEKGDWQRKTFTSRQDNVTITKIEQSSLGEKINMTISIDDISSMNQATTSGFCDVRKMKYKKLVPESADYIAQVAHYPSYEGSELKEGGYAGVTQVITVGGTKERVVLADTGESFNVGEDKNPAIKIEGASEVYLITQSNRTHEMGTLEEFDRQTEYPLLEELLANTRAVAENPDYQTDGSFDYDKALAPHAKLHGDQFNAVKFTLDGDEQDKQISNEALIAKQKNDKSRLNHALIERAYNAGRYAEVCCAGISAPRLCGMWNGEWAPGWRGIYTLDANVNIQVSPMNTGNIKDAPLGYITFFLRNAPDFEENAQKTYGMHDAIQIPVNSDGDKGIMVEYDIYYPFQYWNAGASWTLLPIYEYWQCYGNQKIPISDLVDYSKLRSVLNVEDEEYTQEEMDQVLAKGYLDLEEDILLPLLTKQANFWEQLVTPEYYMDANGKACYEEGKTELEPGETYMLIPTYSPENNPVGYNSTITANATMDIAAARDGLDMVIEMEKAVGREGSEEAIAKWENLKSLLPPYKFDNTASGRGALKEWAMDEYTENNNHRHLSHLYLAWPGYETQNDEELEQAAKQSVENRNEYNTGDATASHGWMHKALVMARLKDGEGIIEALKPLMTGDIYFKSMMTDHDSNRRNNTYCTDTSIGTVGVIQEAMVYSNTGEIEIIPSLPDDWRSGSMNGLMARSRAEVEQMSWDLDKGVASTQIRSDIDQTIRLKAGMEWSEAVVSDPSKAEIENSEYVLLHLNQGDVVTVDFYADTVTRSMLAESIAEASEALDQHPSTDPLYNQNANDRLNRQMEQAKAVYFNGQATAKELREAIWALEAALEVFTAGYEYPLSASVSSGIYQKRQTVKIEGSDNPRFEVRFTMDGSEVTAGSSLYSGPIILPAGEVTLKAAQYIKGTDTQVGGTLEARYLTLPGKNEATKSQASIDRSTYGGQGAEYAVDGNANTRMSVYGNYANYTLTLNLGEAKSFNYLYLDEYVEGLDQETRRIRTFALEYRDTQDGQWKTAASFDENQIREGDFVQRPDPQSGSFHAYYGVPFEEITASQVRLVMTATKEISIWELGLFSNREEKELSLAIQEAQAYMDQADTYQEDSFAAMVGAYENAVKVLEEQESTQASVDQAAQALRAGIAALVKKQPPTPTPPQGSEADFAVTAPQAQVYTGAGLTPAPTVKDGNKVLVQNQDYTLAYENNLNVGTATITVTGKGAYEGVSKKTSFVISPRSVGEWKVKSIGKKTYTGKKITPKPSVSYGVQDLKQGTDYTVSYSGNKAVGTAKLTIHGKGNYTGTKTVTFSIVPKAPSGLKVTKAGGKTAALRWKKVKGATGYVVYRSNKKNGSYKKVKTLKKGKLVSCQSKLPKSGKRYYFYVQSVRKVKGKSYVSKRSKIVSIRY